MLNTLAVSGYRSLRDLVIPLERLNLVTGPNGSGKSNLYRALRLLAETAQGRVIPSLAREGGLQSTLWAGPETFSRAVLRGERPVQGTVRKNPVSLRLGFRRRRLQLRDRSGPSTTSERRLWNRPRDQAGMYLERANASAVGGTGRAPRIAREDPRRETRLDDPHARPGHLRQHDDALCRSAAYAGDADAARGDARVAVLRSFPDRRDGSRAPSADRHAHADLEP